MNDLRSVIVWSVVILAFISLLAIHFLTRRPTTVVSVMVPAELSSAAKAGERSFRAHCQACHGVSGRGSNDGPPLVHRVYAPGHHSDTVFLLAVQLGVRGHHWGARNMPAQPGLDAQTVQNIIAFVREVQRANGIH